MPKFHLIIEKNCILFRYQFVNGIDWLLRFTDGNFACKRHQDIQYWHSVSVLDLENFYKIDEIYDGQQPINSQKSNQKSCQSEMIGIQPLVGGPILSPSWTDWTPMGMKAKQTDHFCLYYVEIVEDDRIFDGLEKFLTVILMIFFSFSFS
jgi:hypothetical protein